MVPMPKTGSKSTGGEEVTDAKKIIDPEQQQKQPDENNSNKRNAFVEFIISPRTTVYAVGFFTLLDPIIVLFAVDADGIGRVSVFIILAAASFIFSQMHLLFLQKIALASVHLVVVSVAFFVRSAVYEPFDASRDGGDFAGIMACYLLCVGAAYTTERSVRKAFVASKRVERRNNELGRTLNLCEKLLLNSIPSSIVRRLQDAPDRAIVDEIPDASVLFIYLDGVVEGQPKVNTQRRVWAKLRTALLLAPSGKKVAESLMKQAATSSSSNTGAAASSTVPGASGGGGGSRRSSVVPGAAGSAGAGAVANGMTPDQVREMKENTTAQTVHRMNDIFYVLDALCAYHGVEKVKTMPYLVMSGCPEPLSKHCYRLACLARDALAFAQWYNKARAGTGAPELKIKTGLHTGKITAGLLGTSQTIYDCFGDTVNLASRLASNGMWGTASCSDTARKRLFHDGAVQTRPRGEVFMKGKGNQLVFEIVQDSVPMPTPTHITENIDGYLQDHAVDIVERHVKGAASPLAVDVHSQPLSQATREKMAANRREQAEIDEQWQRERDEKEKRERAEKEEEEKKKKQQQQQQQQHTFGQTLSSTDSSPLMTPVEKPLAHNSTSLAKPSAATAAPHQHHQVKPQEQQDASAASALLDKLEREAVPGAAPAASSTKPVLPFVLPSSSSSPPGVTARGAERVSVASSGSSLLDLTPGTTNPPSSGSSLLDLTPGTTNPPSSNSSLLDLTPGTSAPKTPRRAESPDSCFAASAASVPRVAAAVAASQPPPLPFPLPQGRGASHSGGHRPAAAAVQQQQQQQQQNPPPLPFPLPGQQQQKPAASAASAGPPPLPFALPNSSSNKNNSSTTGSDPPPPLPFAVPKPVLPQGVPTLSTVLAGCNSSSSSQDSSRCGSLESAAAPVSATTGSRTGTRRGGGVHSIAALDDDDDDDVNTSGRPIIIEPATPLAAGRRPGGGGGGGGRNQHQPQHQQQHANRRYGSATLSDHHEDDKAAAEAAAEAHRQNPFAPPPLLLDDVQNGVSGSSHLGGLSGGSSSCTTAATSPNGVMLGVRSTSNLSAGALRRMRNNTTTANSSSGNNSNTNGSSTSPLKPEQQRHMNFALPQTRRLDPEFNSDFDSDSDEDAVASGTLPKFAQPRAVSTNPLQDGAAEAAALEEEDSFTL